MRRKRFGRTGRFVLPLLLTLVISFLGQYLEAAGEHVLVLSVDGPVTPAMVSYFERGIGQAERDGAEAIVVQLDTPGGQVDITMDIVQLFRSSQVPVIVYIMPSGAQAASAGTVITLAGHLAAMAPQTTLGAASPVGPSGEDLGETLERKVKEDLKATVRALAERRGEDAVAMAESAIEEAAAFNDSEALAAGLVDYVATDLQDLLDQVDGAKVAIGDTESVLGTSSAELVDLPMNPLEGLLHVVVNPTVVTILMAIGVQAILIELSSPGGWVAGFVGIVCLALGLYGLGILPVNWLGLLLVGVAFVLFILDIKAPTHGALTTAAILTLIAGFMVLFNYPGSPEWVQVSVWLIVAISLIIGAFFAFVLTKALRAHRQPPTTGMAALINAVAQVRRPLDPEGTVLVRGERWRAISDDNSEIPAGARVRVVQVDGFCLRVVQDDDSV